MSSILNIVISVLQKSLTSVKGTINIDELLKTIITAMGSGGSIWTILAAIQASAGSIITDPTTLSEFNTIIKMSNEKNWIGLACFTLVLFADLVRRYNQGVDLSPSKPLIKSLNENHPGNPAIEIK